MKQAIWMVALLLPLAGCRQEQAQLAPGEQGQAFAGPVLLRYRFSDQEPTAYRLNVDGEGTGSFQRTPNAQKEPVTARMNSEMMVEQRFAPTTAPRPQAGVTAPAPGSTGAMPSQPQGTTTETEQVPGTEVETAPGGPGTTTGEAPVTGAPETQTAPPVVPTAAQVWQLTQTVRSWNANVQLPNRPLPNQFRAQFENGQLSVDAQGVPVNVPANYRQPIEQTLRQPVTAVVTDQGEILQVNWPVPARYPMRAEEAADGARQFYYFTGHSLGPVNLWFGMIRLPDQEVNVGDTWRMNEQTPVSFQGSGGGQYELQREAHYVLKDLLRVNNERLAVIDVTETLRLAPGEGASAAETPADLMQTRNGTVRFNIDRGTLENAQQEFTVSWNTLVQSPQQSTQTQPVATEGQAKGTLRVERVSGGTVPQAGAPSTGAQQPAPSGTAPTTGAQPTTPPGTVPTTGVQPTTPQGTAPTTGTQPMTPQPTTPAAGTRQTTPQETAPAPDTRQTTPRTGGETPITPGVRTTPDTGTTPGAGTTPGTTTMPGGGASSGGTTPGGLTPSERRVPTR